MRTWGRPYNSDGTWGAWQEVTTDANGFNDAVMLTTLAQTLLLGLNESPFYGDRGIPAQQSVMTQVQPDYYVRYTQQLFAPLFASVIISKRPPATRTSPPTYDISVTSNQGAVLNASVPVPI